MENKEFRIVVTSLVPKSLNYKGKTGGSVRLHEILKRFGGKSEIRIIIIATEDTSEFFKKNGVSAEFRIVKSKLKFKNLLGLCLKSLIILVKSFFVLKLDFLESKKGEVIVYSSSDLFWEVIPAFFYKTKNKGVKWVQVIHHVYPDWKKRAGSKTISFFGYYLQRFSFWLIRKKADRIILVNESVKKDLLKLGFGGNKIAVSSNGIDCSSFDRIKKTDFSYDGVFLARLSPSKGISDLIEIWKNVCNKFPQARLAVIGGGNKEANNYLAKKISGYNLEGNVELLGFLEDEKAYSILKSGKVFLFPSHEEGWGIAIAEAMACGLPVVSWDLPSYREIFEEYITKVEENNIIQFSKNILDLLKNNAKRKEIGDQGREFIKKYSWDNVSKKELEIIRS